MRLRFKTETPPGGGLAIYEPTTKLYLEYLPPVKKDWLNKRKPGLVDTTEVFAFGELLIHKQFSPAIEWSILYPDAFMPSHSVKSFKRAAINLDGEWYNLSGNANTYGAYRHTYFEREDDSGRWDKEAVILKNNNAYLNIEFCSPKTGMLLIIADGASFDEDYFMEDLYDQTGITTTLIINGKLKIQDHE